MLLEGLEALACGDVPQVDGMVVRAAEERGIGHFADTVHRTRMPFEGLEALACGDVPQLDGLVGRPAEECGVGHFADTEHPTRMSFKSSRSRFPNPIP